MYIENLQDLVGEQGSLLDISNAVQEAGYTDICDADLSMNIFDVEGGDERSIAVQKSEWNPDDDQEFVICFEILEADPEAFMDPYSEDPQEQTENVRIMGEAQLNAKMKVIEVYEL